MVSTFVSNPNWLPSSKALPQRAVTPHRRPAQFQAHISDSLPSYRSARLRSSSSAHQSDRLPAVICEELEGKQANIVAADHEKPSANVQAVKPQVEDVKINLKKKKKKSKQITEQVRAEQRFWRAPLYQQLDKRYTIRTAHQAELYTAADIRCEAFYCTPNDVHYHPVRRREIYMAMQSRVNAGTCCIVLVDNDPPWYWQSLASEDGLVVATLDVTFLSNETGKRQKTSADGHLLDNGKGSSKCNSCAYISSMAVRQCWQGKGLAQGMLTYTAQFVRERGVDGLYLHVDWENCGAVHVYLKHGFRTVTEPGPQHWIHRLTKPEHTLMHFSTSADP